jgi:phage shock protein A
MAQQSILGRIGQLARANINAMIHAAEDPEKMLDQMVRDYTTNIAEAEDAVAQTIGNLRMLEEDHQEALENAQEWGPRHWRQSRKGDELRAAGDTAGADRFDSLAKVALQRQLDAEGQVAAFEPQIAAQTEVVERLKTGLDRMRGKLSELTAKRNELVARAKMAEAQTRVRDAVRSVDLMDPTTEVARFEEKVRREEARVLGQQELQASSLDAQFEALEDEGELVEVEARLAALKRGAAPPAIADGRGPLRGERPTRAGIRALLCARWRGWMPPGRSGPCWEEAGMAATFVLKQTSSGKFHFNLVAPNGQVIATSQTYESTCSASRSAIRRYSASFLATGRPRASVIRMTARHPPAPSRRRAPGSGRGLPGQGRRRERPL